MTATKTTIQPLPIQITSQDKIRLEKMIEANIRKGARKDDYTSLLAELDRASVVEPRSIPRNLVTMNSRVSIIDMDTNERLTVTLVFPEDADAEDDRISVLAPIGSGMLGYGVGDEFEWKVPDGFRRFTIAKVDYQPEACNHFDL